jgi:hypothetical protein
MIRARNLIAGWLIVLGCGLAADAPLTIRTSEGLALTLGDDGLARALRIDKREVPLGSQPVLFRLRDAVKQGAFSPVALVATETNGALQLRSREEKDGVRMSATITSRGDFLQIDGEVATSAAEDRCIDLKVSLPAAAAGFAADTGLFNGTQTPVRRNAKKAAAAAPANDPEIDATGAEDNALYPLSPISNRQSGVGLTLAVPPTHPTRFNVGQDATGTFILLRIGLSPAAATPGRTPFRVIAYRHDGWSGFRSALARYYEFYRDPFFTRRVKRIGAWTTQNPSQLAHPQLYAYHEAGFGTWRHPDGTTSGVNVKLTLDHLDEGPIARTLEDYERLCELALDEQHGIYSLPYTIVGQRQLLQLPALPRTLDEAMRTLEEWRPKETIPFDGPPQAGSFRDANEHRAIIRNSGLHDAQGRPAFMPRPYRGPTLTFPQNPNPNLFRGDASKPTVASYTLDHYIPQMLASKFVDGIYLDSLGRWCGFHNFRKEHFTDSTVPLTYSGSPPQVSLWNLQSHAEYMWEAGRRLHAQGKILMANGIGPTRVLLGFASDVMGREGAAASTTIEDFYAPRVAAGVKPYCLLNATHRVSPRIWNAALYMGYLMGCNDPKGLADEARYLPLMIKCNEAGWEPVTHASASPAVVGVERWGGRTPGGALLFTVMNRSTEPVDVGLTISLSALKEKRVLRAHALLNAVAIRSKVDSGQLLLRFRLGPEEAEVIELTK